MDKINKTTKKDSNLREFGRFLVCGVASALTDYLIAQVVVLICHAINQDINKDLVLGLSTFFGFLLGVIVNYLMSTFWVYQNVSKNIKTKTILFQICFVLLSAGAFLLSWGTMAVCNVVTLNAWNINIVDLEIFSLMKDLGIGFLSSASFWAYFISFCLKTIVGLIFNYFTRKYILYRAPKEKEEDK